MLQTVTTMIISLFHKNLSYCCIIVGSSSSRFFEKLAENAYLLAKMSVLSILDFTVTTVTNSNTVSLTNRKSHTLRCDSNRKKSPYCHNTVTICNTSVTHLSHAYCHTLIT